LEEEVVYNFWLCV